MKKKFLLTMVFSLCVLSLFFLSCSSDDGGEAGEVSTPFDHTAYQATKSLYVSEFLSTTDATLQISFGNEGSGHTYTMLASFPYYSVNIEHEKGKYSYSAADNLITFTVTWINPSYNFDGTSAGKQWRLWVEDEDTLVDDPYSPTVIYTKMP